MRYLSVCSGIEAATVAWHPLGSEPLAFSEIEKFPSAVLAHHYPAVPNLGDMTRFHEWPDDFAPDLLVGGTPCQSFSVAGLRQGLDDPRGNLMLTFLAIAERYRPRWVVWENVPGVLSSGRGRDFGAFLGALGQIGYGFAYRVLDAQYFGLAQRRKRVFVVGHLGDWRRAAAVLLEPQGLCGDTPPRRETGERIAPSVTIGPPFSRTGNERVEADAMVAASLGGHAPRYDLDNPLTARMHKGINTTCDEGQTMITHALRADGFDASEDGAGRGTPLVFDTTQITSAANRSTPQAGDPCHPLAASAHVPTLVSNGDAHSGFRDADGLTVSITPAMAVRRLTPRECERLQGFPDDYTRVPYRGRDAADGPRYKALGNSMAVPVVRWIGERIALMDEIAQELDHPSAMEVVV